MRRPPRTPVVVLVALAALIALVGTACGVSAYAARVNGVDISRADLEDELEEILANDSYVGNLEQSGGAVRGEGQRTLRTGFVAQVLSVRIILELIHQELERRDVRISSAVRALASESVVNQVGGNEVLAAFGNDYRAQLTRRTEEVFALQLDLADASLAEEDLRAVYREQGDAFDETCVSHILVSATDAEGNIDPAGVDAQADVLQAKANDLRANIEAGGDFAEVAQAESADTTSGSQGGELGCEPPGRYVPEFEEAVADLDVGVLSEPVRTQFGFHLIKVTDRRPAPFEEVAAQLQQRVLQESQTELQRFIQARLEDAEVEVNPRYGRFDAEQTQVVPPDAPAGEGQRRPRSQPGVPPIP